MRKLKDTGAIHCKIPAGTSSSFECVTGADVATTGAILDRFLHHAQTISITGRSYRLEDHATIAGIEDKNRKIKGKPYEPPTRPRRELRLAARPRRVLCYCLSGYGNHSIFAAKPPH
jgi:hypothetical protein